MSEIKMEKWYFIETKYSLEGFNKEYEYKTECYEENEIIMVSVYFDIPEDHSVDTNKFEIISYPILDIVKTNIPEIIELMKHNEELKRENKNES